MEKLMLFNQMYHDRQPLVGTSIPFFIESDEDSPSITSMSEDAAIKWLFQHPSYRNHFVSCFFESPGNVRDFFGLTNPFTTQNKKPGDIDLLLVHKDKPDMAIAFECKRVKVQALSKEPPKVNNAESIKKGIIQANKYPELGFYKSYFLIILLDDSREQEGYKNTMMRNTNVEQVNKIYNIPWHERRHDDLGIVFIKITQPTGKHYNYMNGIGVCIDKVAGELEQTVVMTNKVRELLKNND